MLAQNFCCSLRKEAVSSGKGTWRWAGREVCMVGQDPDSMPGISLLSPITAGFMAKMIHQHVVWGFFGRCTFTNEWRSRAFALPIETWNLPTRGENKGPFYFSLGCPLPLTLLIALPFLPLVFLGWAVKMLHRRCRSHSHITQPRHFLTVQSGAGGSFSRLGFLSLKLEYDGSLGNWWGRQVKFMT